MDYADQIAHLEDQAAAAREFGMHASADAFEAALASVKEAHATAEVEADRMAHGQAVKAAATAERARQADLDQDGRPYPDPSTEGRFTEGGQATARSNVNSDLVWTFEVVKRTTAFVTLEDLQTGDVYRTKIRTREDGSEWTLPFGSYSMAEVATPVPAT